jgi:hypothetical protein
MRFLLNLALVSFTLGRAYSLWQKRVSRSHAQH